MKITNKNNYPQTLVDAVTADTHITAGNISVTTLIDEPQIRYLKKKHGQDMEQDVSEMIWALFGTAVHHILERANMKDRRRVAFMEVIQALKEHHYKQDIPEEEVQDAADAKKVFTWLMKYMFKYFPEIESRYEFEFNVKYEYNGWVISGQVDLYDKVDKVLLDYKTCSVFQWMFPESRKKWKQQLNTYAFFLREKGYEINGCRVIAIFRDWNRSKSRITPGYPPRQVMEIDITIFKQHELEKWVQNRIRLHQEGEKGNFAPCSDESRWYKPGQFAIMEEGKVRAKAVFEEKQVAEMWIDKNQHRYKDKLTIQPRAGLNKRCEEYCSVAEFCEQFKKIKAESQPEGEWTRTS